MNDLQITQPGIYYGEAMDNEVLVQTRNQEFDFQRGEEEVYGQYSGKGGVAVGGMLTRAMFALRFESMNMLLTSDVHVSSVAPRSAGSLAAAGSLATGRPSQP